MTFIGEYKAPVKNAIGAYAHALEPKTPALPKDRYEVNLRSDATHSGLSTQGALQRLAGTVHIEVGVKRCHGYAVKLPTGAIHANVDAGTTATNDIVQARLALQSPLFVDSYESVRATGSFILIDEATNRTVAAGMAR